MQIGVMFDAQEGMDWARWEWFAHEIERLGYESIWRSDHLVSLVGRPELPTVDAWTSMAYLALQTRRLRFGTLVSPVTWRPPSILGLTALSVDALAGGRLEVGIGAGWEPNEHRAFGIPMPPMPVRYEQLAESAEVLKLLWEQPGASFAGKHFTLDQAHAHPRPSGDGGPPLLIGGVGEKRTLPIVARYADEWNGYSLTPAVLRAKRAVLDGHCEAAGRAPSAIRTSVAAPIAIATTEAGVQARIDRIHEVFPLAGPFPPALAPFTAEKLRGHGWIAGTPPQVVEQLQALEDAGAQRAMLHYLDVEDRDSLALLAQEVLPAVQPAAAG